MPNINKTLVVPYSAEQMYNLINAVESYPEFLPWCKTAEIHARSETELKATIHLAKGPLSYQITTVNSMVPNQSISMQYLAGPFKECAGLWQFIELAGRQCQIKFVMDYVFANRLTAMAVEPMFNPVANTLIEAFYERARQVYAD